MNTADVAVRHPARQLDLCQKALRDRGVIEFRPQDLDGDCLVQCSIVRFVNNAHPALADVFEDFVAMGEDRSRPGCEPGGCGVRFSGRREMVVCHGPQE